MRCNISPQNSHKQQRGHQNRSYTQGCQQVSEQQVMSIKQTARTRNAHHSIPCLEQTQQSELPAQYLEQPVKCAGCRLILTTLIQRERLPRSKMASSDDRFTFEIVHVLHFGNGLNKELCCRFIFTNLQQSQDPQVRCDLKFQSPIW